MYMLSYDSYTLIKLYSGSIKKQNKFTKDSFWFWSQSYIQNYHCQFFLFLLELVYFAWFLGLLKTKGLSKLKPYFLFSHICSWSAGFPNRDHIQYLFSAEHGDKRVGRRSWRLRHGKTLASPQEGRTCLAGSQAVFLVQPSWRHSVPRQHWRAAFSLLLSEAPVW